MESLNNKIAIVTGASKGIGRGIAIALAKQGCKVILAARNSDKLKQVAIEITEAGGSAQAIVSDVTDEQSVDNLFEQVKESYGRLDILVNNAGMAVSGRIDELSLSDWQQVQDVNVTGIFLCCRGAARIMKPQKGGRIINIGSISGQMPRVKSSPYTTSKFAVTGLTKALALELRPYNIAVCAVHPGNVMTDIWEKTPQVPEQEGVMEVADLAEVVVTIATLPDHVNLFESVILPVSQPYLGRG
ncbi:MAG: SDR family NAD(P)-dependent oxidoreductase [Gammaproteobacteria bacterium]|nr:MAG: SDR family NAD(P)-dependent oxidoreductase [Gammaproteobacteria bacterium]